MILPKKHIKLSESLFAIGAVILKELNEPKTVDEIWEVIINNKLISRVSFDNLILTLDYLYTVDLLQMNDEGRIFRCT